MRRAALVLLAVLVATVLACADEDDVDPWAYLPRSTEFALAIENPGARTRQPATRAELEAALPFEPVLPTWLPEGFRFLSASVHPVSEGRSGRFSASFAPERPSTGEGFARIVFYSQSPSSDDGGSAFPLSPDDPRLHQVELGSFGGTLLRPGGRPGGPVLLMLVWDACGSRFAATYDARDGSAADEEGFLRMARSMVEACD